MSVSGERRNAVALALLAGFVALHVVSRVAVLRGAPLTAPWPTHPARALAELLVLGGALGVHLHWRARGAAPAPARLRDALGVIGLAFVVLHVLHVRVPLARGLLLPREAVPRLMAELSSTAPPGVPLVAIGYLAGSAAALAYLAWTGAPLLAARAPRLRRALPLVVAAAGLAVVLVVVFLATGWHPLSP